MLQELVKKLLETAAVASSGEPHRFQQSVDLLVRRKRTVQTPLGKSSVLCIRGGSDQATIQTAHS